MQHSKYYGIPSFLVITLLVSIGLVLTSGCKSDNDGMSDLERSALVLYIDNPNIISGDPVSIRGGSAAASAVSSATSAAMSANGVSASGMNSNTVSLKGARGTTTIADTFTLNDTFFCPGPSGSFISSLDTDTGNGSITFNNVTLKMNGTSTTSGEDYTIDVDVSISGSITYNNCHMLYIDYNKLAGWDGSDPADISAELTLNGTLNASDSGSQYIDSTGSTSGTVTTSEAVLRANSAGTITSSNFTVLDASSNTILDSVSVDIDTTSKANMTGYSKYDNSVPSGSSTLSGTGNYTMTGIVGGNTVKVDWTYNMDYSYSY